MIPSFIPMIRPSFLFARVPSRAAGAADAIAPVPGSPQRPPPTSKAADRASVAVPLKATF
jgi:hypothetical protein